jgi:pimeloyl-ACP methyl ester carboxylesterase
MPGKAIQHIVVLVPGIMGSVLKKDDQEVWSFSQSFLNSETIRNEKRHAYSEFQKKIPLENLLLNSSLMRVEEMDGITAEGLIQDSFLIPGFIKMVNGYSRIRAELTQRLPLKLDDNYFEFAYDWRLSNEVSADELKKFVDGKLEERRRNYPNSEVKAIIIAHSMGGLIARHYLEHLGGAQDCKTLITLGTPFNGSIKMLDYLVNGYSVEDIAGRVPGFIGDFLVKLINRWFQRRVQYNPFDLTEMLLSFNSVYQLLPPSPVIHNRGTAKELANINIECLDSVRVAQGKAFLDNLLGAKTSGYDIFLVAGIGQPTFQSARIDRRLCPEPPHLIPSYQKPSCYQRLFSEWTGDDTVPQYSAAPQELIQNCSRETFGTTHGSLPSNEYVLSWLCDQLKRLLIPDGPQFLPVERVVTIPAISLTTEDLYVCTDGQPVEVRADFFNVEPNILTDTNNFGGLHAVITSVRASEQQPIQAQFDQESHLLTIEPDQLTPGLYELEVKTGEYDEQFIDEAPESVKTLFHVI